MFRALLSLKQKIRLTALVSVTFALPQVSFAASTYLCQNMRDFKTVVGCALSVLTLVVPLLIGFALLAFLYGLLQYVSQGGSVEMRTKGAQLIIYGTIGLFVMISVYGLVNVLLNTFAFGGAGGAGSVIQDPFNPYYTPTPGANDPRTGIQDAWDRM